MVTYRRRWTRGSPGWSGACRTTTSPGPTRSDRSSWQGEGARGGRGARGERVWCAVVCSEVPWATGLGWRVEEVDEVGGGGVGGEGVGPGRVAASGVVVGQGRDSAAAGGREDARDGRAVGRRGGCWSSCRRGCARGRRRGSLDGVLGRRLDEAGSLRRAEMRRRLSPSALHLRRQVTVAATIYCAAGC
jgi:hypothetical protein